MALRKSNGGLQYSFPGDSETLRLVNRWVGLERRCCPFLTFTVISTGGNEQMILRLTGSEEAKAFLLRELRMNIDRIGY
ncbi:hypothetical protein [Cohnella zeiphila]|uniref:hypothetical protein n=1 Tax=Cohnella zeiphila TaxID=2761120 RepID=UPI001EE34B0E|nr:hypothetical protein [Cohnella zeiphila]